MYLIDAVQLDYSPRRKIEKYLPELPSLIKMNEQDSAFVCGLLGKFSPRKIVEVGIGHGGTTAVMMQCLCDMELFSSIFSVDILEHGYNGTDKEIGFLGGEAAHLLQFDDYRLFKGVCLPQVIDQIGSGIDFLILDTMHKLPGEALDFLIAYPYLSEDAVVCLHDISQNQKIPPDARRIATNVLINSVAADKFLNSDPIRIAEYPNIGAFQVNPDTAKYITNVFGSLTQNWSYLLDERSLNEYTRVIHSHYPAEVCWLYDSAVTLNNTTCGMNKPDEIKKI